MVIDRLLCAFKRVREGEEKKEKEKERGGKDTFVGSGEIKKGNGMGILTYLVLLFYISYMFVFLFVLYYHILCVSGCG